MWRLNLIEDESLENFLSLKNQQQMYAYKTNYFFTIVLRPYLTIPIQHFSKPIKNDSKIRNIYNTNISNSNSQSSSRASICSSSSSSSNLPVPPSLLRLDCKQSLVNDQNNTSDNLPSLLLKKEIKKIQQVESMVENDFKPKKVIKSLKNNLSKQTDLTTDQIDLETRFPLICCHIDIKQQFIRSIEKGQKICAYVFFLNYLNTYIKFFFRKHKYLRPTSQISSQSDWGYYSAATVPPHS